MSSGLSAKDEGKPLRILTIDNGGLQAISILCLLKEVCKRLSQQDGHKTSLRPCQLFDIIGGVGTGGWLAILLGRYRLRIDQCMSIYVTIANAIDSTRARQDGSPLPGDSVALDQDILIDKIDKIVAEHEIGEHLFDEQLDGEDLPESRRCHAFAVGVVKRAPNNTTQEYRLFRTYQPPAGAKHNGPDPRICKASSACAATAAAKDFLSEWKLDTDGVTYWDETFPSTHNVSGLALDEAASLYGKERSMNLDFVLNISPGVASKKDVQELQRTTTEPGSSKPIKHRMNVRRFFSASRIQDLTKLSPCVQVRSATYTDENKKYKFPVRSDTSGSTSSDASQTELGHQKAIRERLQSYVRTSRRAELYFRLELSAQNDKPYLDDIAKPDLAMKLAQEFLGQSNTEIILNTMVPQRSITERPTSQSPRQSFASVKDFAPVKELPAIEAH